MESLALRSEELPPLSLLLSKSVLTAMNERYTKNKLNTIENKGYQLYYSQCVALVSQSVVFL